MSVLSRQAFALFMFLCLGIQAKQKQPNILFIFSDDHSTNAIGAYGSKINTTPNIDRIANEGASLKNLSVLTQSVSQVVPLFFPALIVILMV